MSKSFITKTQINHCIILDFVCALKDNKSDTNKNIIMIWEFRFIPKAQLREIGNDIKKERNNIKYKTKFIST